AAEEVLLREWHVRRIAVHRPDRSELQTRGNDQTLAAGNRQIVPAVHRGRVVIECPRHDAAGLLAVKRDLISVMRVENVVGGGMLEIETEGVERSALFTGR